MAGGLVDSSGRPLASTAPKEVGCDVCGRGALRITVAGTRRIDTSLIKVPCTNKRAHEAGGTHVGRCPGVMIGQVYVHRDMRICIAVKHHSRN